MGLIIVMVVGATLGWLVAIVVDRDDRMGSAACALAGTAGAAAGALLAGDIPLLSGISPTQLLWAVVCAIIVIVLTNVAAVRSDASGQRNV
jgi:uncharacterized membrane protein YeaQ/YmgE (transglycosylase-associated protein family)